MSEVDPAKAGSKVFSLPTRTCAPNPSPSRDSLERKTNAPFDDPPEEERGLESHVPELSLTRSNYEETPEACEAMGNTVVRDKSKEDPVLGIMPGGVVSDGRDSHANTKGREEELETKNNEAEDKREKSDVNVSCDGNDVAKNGISTESDEAIATRLAVEWAEEALTPKGETVGAEGREGTDNQSFDFSYPNFKVHSPANFFGADAARGVCFDDIKYSYASVHVAAHKVAKLYADQYNNQILHYIEEWERVISSRIQGRIMQFNKLRFDLNHYERKLDGLRTKKERENTRKKSQASPKASERFDRNELKLSGSREACDAYGESLLLLIDETTERAWRDFYPLLLRSMQFDINLSADQAGIFSGFDETMTILKAIGVEKGLNIEGRVKILKDSRPEEFYTGKKKVVRPIVLSNLYEV